MKDAIEISMVFHEGNRMMAVPKQSAVQEPDLIARLKNPEDHYEFTDPKKANAVLMSLCQEAADALAAAPVREPVAWMQSDEVHISLWKDDYHTIPLCVAPFQFQPLTEEAVLECWKQVYEPGRREHDNATRMARAIEAAHGITKGQS
jgi:hypothetical protein